MSASARSRSSSSAGFDPRGLPACKAGSIGAGPSPFRRDARAVPEPRHVTRPHSRPDRAHDRTPAPQPAPCPEHSCSARHLQLRATSTTLDRCLAAAPAEARRRDRHQALHRPSCARPDRPTELSWLKPAAAAGRDRAFHRALRVAQHHRDKSFCLYQQLQQQSLDDAQASSERLKADLSDAALTGSERKGSVRCSRWRRRSSEMSSTSFDGPSLTGSTFRTQYQPAPELLRADHEQAPVTETGQRPAQEQPSGDRPARLGQRAHQLHRAADRPGSCCSTWQELQPQRVPPSRCVEPHLSCGIWTRCKPVKSQRSRAASTRRGGLDINPWRSSQSRSSPWPTSAILRAGEGVTQCGRPAGDKPAMPP